MRSLITAVIIVSFCVVMALVLAGCGTPPEPVIKTVTVETVVTVPCTPALPARPALMTRDQVRAAVSNAATLDDRVKIITGQLLLYLGWTGVVEAALQGCKDGR